MAALRKAGISAADAKLVLSYENAEDYINEALKTQRADRYEMALSIARSVRIAMHGNKNEYEAWTGYLVRELRALSEEEEKPARSIFERLKNTKPDTVFERIRKRGAEK